MHMESTVQDEHMFLKKRKKKKLKREMLYD